MPKPLTQETERECRVCHYTLPIEEFMEFRSATGNSYPRKDCKKCKNENLRNIKFLAQYGITLTEYNRMEQEQNSLCAICGRPESRARYGKRCRLCVDHNEETGQVRGLLCSNCNLAIGLLNHDPVMVSAAVTYLVKYEEMERDTSHATL